MTDKRIESLRQAFMKENEPPAGECPMGDQATAYAFGELSTDEAKKVEAHIHTCRHCLDLVMEIRMADEEAAALQAQEVPVLPGLQQAINKGKEPKDSPFTRIVSAISDFFANAAQFKPVPALATMAIIIVAGVLMFRSPESPYTIQILMHGRTQVGIRGGQPEYKEFQVEAGGTMQSGDYFRFQTRIDKPAFVYVVFQDSAGKIDSLEKGLIPGGQDFLLPGGDQWFQLDKNTGTERIYMLASKDKIEDFGQKVDALRTAGIEKITQIFPRAKIQLFSFVHQ